MVSWNEHEILIKGQNAEAWEEFKKQHDFSETLTIRDKVFIELNLEGYDFSFIRFEKCKFVDCNLSQSFMIGATFSECEFANGTNLTKATFGRGARTPNNAREFANCEFYQCNLSEVRANGIVVENTQFRECDLTNATLIKSVFSQSVDFRDSNLSGCNFSESTIHKAGWSNCKINEDTNFYKVDFITSYPLTNDGSDSISFNDKIDKHTDWSRVRFYSSIPVFGITWTAFVVSVLLINLISYLNETKLVETMGRPLGVPNQVGFIITGTILLAVSSTIYKFKCPDTVQNFTQTEWVYEHKHPRIFYQVDLLRNKEFRIASVFLMYLGGAVTLFPALVHMASAIRYLLEN